MHVAVEGCSTAVTTRNPAQGGRVSPPSASPMSPRFRPIAVAIAAALLQTPATAGAATTPFFPHGIWSRQLQVNAPLVTSSTAQVSAVAGAVATKGVMFNVRN